MAQNVHAKKHFSGQHFLRVEGIAKQISNALEPKGRYERVLEIGPGHGNPLTVSFSAERI